MFWSTIANIAIKNQKTKNLTM